MKTKSDCLADFVSEGDPIVEDLQIMQEALHYRDWIFRLISPFIGNRIIEVGAGLGSFTSLLTDREAVVALDAHFPCFLQLAQSFRHCPAIIPIYGDITDPLMTKLSVFRADTVLAINVLEHIGSDLQALRRIRHYLGDSGRLIIVVPAYKFLYGATDKMVGHVRRYSMPGLQGKLAGAGFRTMHTCRFNSLAVPAWFVNGRIFKRTTQSSRQVGVYDRRIVPWLSRIEATVPPPFGLSIMAVAEPK
jgi:SAM-dependent methyltransferase